MSAGSAMLHRLPPLPLALLAFLALGAQGGPPASGWSYHGKQGPAKWAGLCQSGDAQSPINLAGPEYVDMPPFQFSHYDLEPWVIKVTNNGHSLKALFQSKTNYTPSFRGGGLPDEYEFAQFHFHWGGGSDRGSEHTVEGKPYPLELHLVHFNTKYDSVGEAAAESDGLAVLGIFFEISNEDGDPDDEDAEESEAIGAVVDVFDDGAGPGESKTLPRILPLGKFLPANTGDFFRYQGSLTTPPCFESVAWTVFTEPVVVSLRQLAKFRNLQDSDGYYMKDNYRPVMPLNGRPLYVSLSNYSKEAVMPAVTERKRYGNEKPREVDHFFLLIMSIIIFFMQCGFAFMEAGAVRSKNTVNILIKNWLDMCIGALVYWAVGFALTFGDSPEELAPFFGTKYFFFIDMPDYKLSKWFFQFVFAATAATLVSGSLAERCNFIAYIVYSIMITGFIYPVVAHWAWHQDGWLNQRGYHDFAGSGVVHLTGAVCALVGCILMGPRIGRFDKDGKTIPMPGHSVPLSALGGLILIFGFFACNGTKQGSISHPGDGVAVATAIVNTALGTAAAGISTLLFNKTGIVPGTGGTYSFLATMNGSLTGTVALCAGCNVFSSWASVVVGGVSGPLFLYFRYVLLSHQIDDPLDAIPVHGAGGVWGTLSVYIFKEDGLLLSASTEALEGFGWNVVGMLTIIVWTGVMCWAMFALLQKAQMLRVETEHEFKGMDLLKHGESAYPADAWVEQQYMNDDGVENTIGVEEPEDKDKPEKVKSKAGLPPNMKFSRSASYNNPHEMFPAASKMFKGMNSVAGNVTVTKSPRPPPKGLSTVGEEGTDDEKAYLRT